MANPTTNYSFVLPTSSDLVTDLPADFDVALQGVDTRLKALQPGTTSGDLAYSSATANTNVRLGIGSTNQVLSVVGGVPAWAAAQAGGMTLISTTSLTGASVSLSSIPGTYKNLQVVIRNFQPATDDQNLTMRFNGDATASRHKTVIIDNNSVETFDAAQVTVSQPTDSTATKNLQIINIFDYTNTTTFKLANNFNITQDFTTPTSIYFSNRSFGYNQIGAITSLYFAPGSGNFTAGTILLYGVS